MNRLGLAWRAAALLVVVTSWWWGPALLRPMSFFAVRQVDVSGTRYLEPTAVVAALALRPEASVFDDRASLERRLESAAGIASARVSRRLPGTLVVELVEVEPVALAEGPSGLVPLSKNARPLPYDVVARPVDAPIVRDADRLLLEALREVQATDPGLYADVAAARASGGDLVLDMTQGGSRVRLDMPVEAGIVQSVSAVRRDLAARDVAWRELDGRFRGWVVVKKGGQADGRSGGQPAVSSRPGTSRGPATRSPGPAARPPVRRTAGRL